MIIRKKLDAMEFLEEFTNIASFDSENAKHYFVFDDKERGGQYTLMKKENQWSFHGMGENYCDDGETMIDDIDDLLNFLWKHRSKINQVLKEVKKATMKV